jgi:TetR/AcrR family transcriptional repressor of mexJK operon
MAYYQRAPEHVMAALATELSRLESRGLLRLDDPLLAASHFAYLVLGLPLDRAMFSGAEHPSAAADLDRRADAAVRVFLAAYGSPAGPATAQSPEGPAGPATAQSPEGS